MHNPSRKRCTNSYNIQKTWWHILKIDNTRDLKYHSYVYFSMLFSFGCWTFTKGKNRLLCLLAVAISFLILDYFGMFMHLFEINYKHFEYPLNVDLISVIKEIKSKGYTNTEIINPHNFEYILPNKPCYNPVFLLILVKSALNNAVQREVIRRTWGKIDTIKDVNIRVLFLLGFSDGTSEIESVIKNESYHKQDLIQENFHDTYYNNSLKTIMGLKWATSNCPKARYLLFSDDDMFINVTNIVKLLKEQNHIAEPKYFVGFVFFSSPLRHKSSKWFITLEDYPYSMYPPYVTAMAFILSLEATTDLYYGSLFTKQFPFDDVYLGIIAKKVGIQPKHNPHFYFWKKKYSKEGYKDVIASHGYNDPTELLNIWMDQ